MVNTLQHHQQGSQEHHHHPVDHHDEDPADHDHEDLLTTTIRTGDECRQSLSACLVPGAARDAEEERRPPRLTCNAIVPLPSVIIIIVYSLLFFHCEEFPLQNCLITAMQLSLITPSF